MLKIFFTILLITIILLSLKLILRICTFLLLLRNFGLNGIIRSFIFKQTTNASPDSKNNQEENNQKMVKCVKCQLYIPENKAYLYQGNFYCCKEHTDSA